MPVAAMSIFARASLSVRGWLVSAGEAPRCSSLLALPYEGPTRRGCVALAGGNWGADDICYEVENHGPVASGLGALREVYHALRLPAAESALVRRRVGEAVAYAGAAPQLEGSEKSTDTVFEVTVLDDIKLVRAPKVSPKCVGATKYANTAQQ